MTVQHDLQRHRATLGALEGLLDAFPDEAWTRAPAPGAWCPAEVYDHIGRIAEGYVLPRLRKCLSGQGQAGSRTLAGHLLLWMARIPGAWRIRAPFPPELLPKPITRDEARVLLSRLRTHAENLAPEVEAADPAQRARHFRLGWINAEEWYRFMEMHHRHHLEGQLRRLAASQGAHHLLK